jgi:hypothetical protein
MCCFFTAVLPQEADVAALDALARAHGRQFLPQPNPGIEAQLHKSERYFLTTTGFCDCGTALGARGRRHLGKSPDRQAGIKRLRATGWSEAKIARSLAQQEDAAARAEKLRGAHDVREPTEWLEFIGEVLNSSLTPYLGILLHWHSGSLSERISVAGREVVGCSALSAEVPVDAREDVLDVFQRAGLEPGFQQQRGAEHPPAADAI